MRNSEFLELCKPGNTVDVDEAIANGADVNASDNSGRTALFMATLEGHVDTENLLRSYGAK